MEQIAAITNCKLLQYRKKLHSSHAISSFWLFFWLWIILDHWSGTVNEDWVSSETLENYAQTWASCAGAVSCADSLEFLNPKGTLQK